MGRSAANRTELKINLGLIINELKLPAQIKQPILRSAFTSFSAAVCVCVGVHVLRIYSICLVSTFSRKLFFLKNKFFFFLIQVIFSVCRVGLASYAPGKLFPNLGLHQNTWETLSQDDWAPAPSISCLVSLRTPKALEPAPQKMDPSTPCE